MSAALIPGIVRILKANGETAGMGFVLTADGLVATCAHVVGFAGSTPGGSVSVIFEVNAERRFARVDVESWRDAGDEDVAFLHVAGGLPEGVASLSLGTTAGVEGHPITTYGYPPGRGGIVGTGKIEGEPWQQGMRVLQLNSTQIVTGFSGAPVLDRKTGLVIGMVASFAKPLEERLDTTAFCTRAETLREIYPGLKLSTICPYRGLESFERDHASIFFGREQVVASLVEKLRNEPRFLAVLGPSGSGKSSVVRAGLIPELGAGKIPGSNTWGVIVIRPGSDPFIALANEGVRNDDGDLVLALQAWQAQRPNCARVVLIVDQFEELFTTCPEDTCERFTNQLARLLERAPAITLILTLRNEFYGRFTQLPPLLVEYLTRGLYNVPLTLTRDEVMRIVLGPAESVGLKLEDGLADAIITDALTVHASDAVGEGAPSTVLPLLEFTLMELWNKGHAHGLLTNADYRELGRVTGSLAQWADNTYITLKDESRPLMERILKGLVFVLKDGDQMLEIPIRKPLGTLWSDAGEREHVEDVAHELEAARLLVIDWDGKPPVETVGLIHDALLREWSRFRDWVDADREFIVWKQETESDAAEWQAVVATKPQQSEAWLLRGLRLENALNWERKRGNEIKDEARTFIAESQKLQEREQAQEARAQQRERRQNRVAFGILVTFVVGLSIAAGVAGVQWQHADEANQTVVAVNGNLQTANQNLQTANQTVVAGNANLATAVAQTQIEQQIGKSRELAASALAQLDNDPELSVLLARQALDTWDTPQAESAMLSAVQASRIRASVAGTGMAQATLNRDATSVITAENGTVRVVELKSGRTTAIPDKEIFVSAAQSHNGALIATAGSAGLRGARKVNLWDASSMQTGTPLTFFSDFQEDVGTVLFSANDKYLAAIVHGRGSYNSDIIPVDSEYGSVIVWNLQTHQPRDLGGGISHIAFSATDDERLLTAGSSNSIKEWVLNSDQQPKTFKAGQEEQDGTTVVGVAFVRDAGQERAVALTRGVNNVIQVWGVADGGNPVTLTGLTSPATHAAISSDGSRIVAGSDDGRLMVWEAKRIVDGSDGGSKFVWDAQILHRSYLTLIRHAGKVVSTAFSEDGTRVVSASDADGAKIWDVTTGEQATAAVSFMDDPMAGGVVISPDSSRIVTVDRYECCEDGNVQVWDAGTLMQDGMRPMPVDRVAFSAPDGQIFIVTGNTLAKWDVLLRTRTWEKPLMGDARIVAVSPDGTRVVRTKGIGGMEVWNTDSDAESCRLPDAPLNSPFTGGFSPDGQRIAFVSGMGRTVWDADCHELSLRRGEQPAAENFDNLHLAFRPDGAQIITVDATGVEIVDAAGEFVRMVPGDPRRVKSVTFSRDGKWIVAAYDDGTLRTWSARTGESVLTVVLGDGVSFVTFSPDGRWMLVGKEPAGSKSTISRYSAEIYGTLDELRALARTHVTRDFTPDERRQYSI